MKVLRKEEMKNIIYVEEIQEGLKNYTNGLLSVKNATVDEFKGFIKEMETNIIVDYYGNIIKDNEFELLVGTLSKEEELYLRDLRENKVNEEILFKEVEDKLLDIIVKLSYEEILFSSFYLGKSLTIWGNFNKEFVVFFGEEVNTEEVKAIGNRYNIEIKDIREVN